MNTSANEMLLTEAKELCSIQEQIKTLTEKAEGIKAVLIPVLEANGGKLKIGEAVVSDKTTTKCYTNEKVTAYCIAIDKDLAPMKPVINSKLVRAYLDAGKLTKEQEQTIFYKTHSIVVEE